MHAHNDTLTDIYQRLLTHFGAQDWWPADTPFEVMVGAVLTQNTNWHNVAKGLANLRQADCLSFAALLGLSHAELATFIRPTGYYNLKATRLQNLLALIQGETGGDLELFLDQDLETMRAQLLSVKGIGPETADSIILYAAEKPVFVVDTYTHRLLSRHGLVGEESSYDEMQELFMATLPEDTALFNEFHALIVCLGKEFCRKQKPRCATCPLGVLL